MHIGLENVFFFVKKKYYYLKVIGQGLTKLHLNILTLKENIFLKSIFVIL